MTEVTIYTDGACIPNPGPGGWAAILICGQWKRQISGSEARTTSNRMEMTAAIEALRALKRPCRVVLHTDSRYVMDGMTRWIWRWRKNGFRTRTEEPVKNADLWEALDQAARPHTVQWRWVKGHSGNEHNERCDALARHAAASAS